MNNYFTDLICEQPHKDSLYGKPSSEGLRCSYSRKTSYNQKRLKQTVFKLSSDSNKGAV